MGKFIKGEAEGSKGRINVTDGINHRKIKKELLKDWLAKHPGYYKGCPPRVGKKIGKSLSGDNNPSKRADVRSKISKSLSGSKNPMYNNGYKIRGEKNGMHGRSGSLNPMYGVHLVPWNKGVKITDVSEEYAAKMRENLSKARLVQNIKYISNFESEIVNYLKCFFKLHQQYRIKNSRFKHPYDMMIELPNGINLIIEADGDHWHNGGWYDQLRGKVASKHGYAYLEIRQSDYNKKGRLKYVKQLVSSFFPEFINWSRYTTHKIKFND